MQMQNKMPGKAMKLTSQGIFKILVCGESLQNNEIRAFKMQRHELGNPFTTI